MEEIWKDIEGYEGIYRVSNLGRVKSLGRVVKSKDGSIRTLKERILKPALTSNAYVRVPLRKEGKHKNFKIHRLVANTFIPNPNNKPQVNHIDGDKTNNCVDNLEWCTPKENTQHAIDTGLQNNKGTKNGNSKLTEKEVLEIRESNLSQYKLAEKYGVSQKLISFIKRRKFWKHI